MLGKAAAWGIIGINGRLCEITLNENEADRWKAAGRDVVDVGVITNVNVAEVPVEQRPAAKASNAGGVGPSPDGKDGHKDTGDQPGLRSGASGKGPARKDAAPAPAGTV